PAIRCRCASRSQRANGDAAPPGQALRCASNLRISRSARGAGDRMRELSISRAWEEAKDIVAREGRLLAAVALALIVLPQVLMNVVGPPIDPQATQIARALYIAAILLGFIAQIA